MDQMKEILTNFTIFFSLNKWTLARIVEILLINNYIINKVINSSVLSYATCTLPVGQIENFTQFSARIDVSKTRQRK